MKEEKSNNSKKIVTERISFLKRKNSKISVGKNIFSSKAITLISLIITIIVLIILASIAIYLSIGNNGMFVRSKEAKEITNKQEATDIINLKITTAQMNKYAEKQEMPTLKELSVTLGSDDEIEYVTEKSQIASKKYEVGENPSSIFTKLNNYPYEFEINYSLQLASINGIKIADDNVNNNVAYNKTVLYERNEENQNQTVITFNNGHTVDEFDSIKILYGNTGYGQMQEVELLKESYEYIVKNSNDHKCHIELTGYSTRFIDLYLETNGFQLLDASAYIIHRIYGIKY